MYIHTFLIIAPNPLLPVYNVLCERLLTFAGIFDEVFDGVGCGPISAEVLVLVVVVLIDEDYLLCLLRHRLRQQHN